MKHRRWFFLDFGWHMRLGIDTPPWSLVVLVLLIMTTVIAIMAAMAWVAS